ncbi:nucleotidyltransferase [Bacillaceae bacterium SAS-127]|nr:nucleotidyltransferase [Bacillaceae bacterium SAS-127]
MNDFHQKYEESIRLSYQYAVRMFMHLKNVIQAMENIEQPDELTKEVYRDSIIKKYEMLEDLLWKLLSKIFKSSGLEINNPRGCYKQAFKEGFIEDIAIWNEILLSRNATAHIYNEDDYEKIKNNIVEKYMEAIEQLLEKLERQVM